MPATPSPPTPSAPTPIAPTPFALTQRGPTPQPIEGCVITAVNFDTLPDGTDLSGGSFLSNHYLQFYGFTFSGKQKEERIQTHDNLLRREFNSLRFCFGTLSLAIGGFGTLPRLFDTSDFTLGSRNRGLGR